MKIISYNINGINALYNNGKLDQLLSDYPADIYCFQETKGNETKVDMILNKAGLGEDYVWYSCSNTWKKGYSGVVTLIRKDKTGSLARVTCPEMFDQYGEGRIVTLEFTDWYLVNVYVLNSGNKDELRMTFDQKFREYIASLDKPVVIVGDMNVCHTELDYWGNYRRAINSCAGLMQFEIYGMDRLVDDCQLVDSYRVIHGVDRKYTWFSNRDKLLRNGWRIDYGLVSTSIVNRIKDADIYEKYQAPDHSPIMIEFDC